MEGPADWPSEGTRVERGVAGADLDIFLAA